MTCNSIQDNKVKRNKNKMDKLKLSLKVDFELLKPHMQKNKNSKRRKKTFSDFFFVLDLKLVNQIRIKWK